MIGSQPEINVSSTPLRPQSPGLLSHPCGLSSLVPKAAIYVWRELGRMFKQMSPLRILRAWFPLVGPQSSLPGRSSKPSLFHSKKEGTLFWNSSQKFIFQ